MAQKKTDKKKPLIILCAVVIVAVLAFLIYDEVQSNSYLNQLNEAISSTASLESGSAVGHSYLYAEGADRESGSSETRHAIYLRGDDGITFQESAGNEDGSELTSNFYIRPGEYFYLDTENDQWVRTDLQEGLDVRPYSLSAATSSVSSSQIRRIHKTTVDGKDAFEVIYNRQWLMSSYQGQSTDEPLTGSVIYILATDGDTTYVEETRQTLNVRVTDSEGNIDRNTVHAILYGEDTEPKVKPKSVKISYDIYTKYFSNGEKPKEITETIEKALELYFKNMEDK